MILEAFQNPTEPSSKPPMITPSAEAALCPPHASRLNLFMLDKRNKTSENYLELEETEPSLVSPDPSRSPKLNSWTSNSAFVLKEASIAPAKVPVTRRVDWLDAGAQATVATWLISFVSMPVERTTQGSRDVT